MRRVSAAPRATLALLAGLAVGLLGTGAVIAPAPRLIWNASASAPLGLYWVGRSLPEQGQLVLVETPESVRALAAARGYLPAGVPLVKRVVALAGAEVCGLDRLVLIDGRAVAERLAQDAQGRPLPAWNGCRVLEPDEIFLLQEGVAGSFDGRYFGPVKRSTVLGILVPLWTYEPEERGSGRRGAGGQD